MKYFEPTYYLLLSTTLVNWLISAKDIVSSVTAILLGIMTCIYMCYKIKVIILDVKLKSKELKK